MGGRECEVRDIVLFESVRLMIYDRSVRHEGSYLISAAIH